MAFVEQAEGCSRDQNPKKSAFLQTTTDVAKATGDRTQGACPTERAVTEQLPRPVEWS